MRAGRTSHPVCRRLRNAALCGAALCAGAGAARAHEPVHSFGPNTLWKGGTAIECYGGSSWGERWRHGSHVDDDPANGRVQDAEVRLHVAHGLGADFLVFADAPLTWRLTDIGGRSRRALGVGDVLMGAKYRFWRRQDEPARADQAAVLAALRLPTGRTGTHPPLGSGRPELILGTAAARDALYLYLWGNVRVHVPIPGGRKLAPWQFATSAAAGVRFWEPAVGRGGDFVLLLETEYHAEAPGIARGHTEPDTGHQEWAAGPGFLAFYGTPWCQLEFKGGIQFALWQRARGRQYLTEARFVLGFGIMF